MKNRIALVLCDEELFDDCQQFWIFGFVGKLQFKQAAERVNLSVKRHLSGYCFHQLSLIFLATSDELPYREF